MIGKNEKVEAAKRVDIKAYLQQRGVNFNAQDFCSSPFSRDSNWSFKYYSKTNTFFDWSKGFGGDVIRLVMLMDNISFGDALDQLTKGNYTEYKPNYKIFQKETVPFQLERFLNESETDCKSIREYAASRSIRRGFECGLFFTKEQDGVKWKRNPALAFVLRDKHLGVCGIKFRKIYPPKPGDTFDLERFSSRGSQGFYILENILPDSYDDPTVFLIESETSANSLWEYCCKIKKNVIVISFGSVGSQFDELPIPYQNLKDRRLIIDYDGNEELYQQRLKNFEHLNARPIKIILPKGEDINSLYSSNQMFKISNLLFNG